MGISRAVSLKQLRTLSTFSYCQPGGERVDAFKTNIDNKDQILIYKDLLGRPSLGLQFQTDITKMKQCSLVSWLSNPNIVSLAIYIRNYPILVLQVSQKFMCNAYFKLHGFLPS